MVTRDMFGNFLSDGDAVTVALSPGTFLVGKIAKISTGIDGQPPVAYITVTMPLPVHQTGLVQGIIKVNIEEEKKVIGE